MLGRKVLAFSFGTMALAYAIGFNVSTRLDAEIAWSRFVALSAGDHHDRAAKYGDRALKAWDDEERTPAAERPADLNIRRRDVADAHYKGGNPRRAARYYASVLADSPAEDLSDTERTELNRRIAALDLRRGRTDRAVLIVARFLERSGDAAALEGDQPSPEHLAFLALVDQFRPAFVDALPADGSTAEGTADGPRALDVAEAMTKLGGHYAAGADGTYAAAGLLATAHRIRTRALGPDHEDTVQTSLLLAPVYERMDRLADAERLYQQVFRTQERLKGSNNPELSLYIRLLVGVYEKQGRATEAAALNRHMRQIFRDAFGARRYAANRTRDRSVTIDRPVSARFPLAADYAPADLVAASTFGIPLSKAPYLEEMKVSRAAMDGTSLPEQLAKLLNVCAVDGERLSLRSGFRSHRVQAMLLARNKNKGTVAEPGTSEHQSGLAVDIDVNRRFMRSTDRTYACFEKKAWRHGFILSFPPGNTYLAAEDPYEPWHWRYVGQRTALLYREIGPWGQPQEFLAALPCYEEKGRSGLYLDRQRSDICKDPLNDDLGREEKTG